MASEPLALPAAAPPLSLRRLRRHTSISASSRRIKTAAAPAPASRRASPPGRPALAPPAAGGGGQAAPAYGWESARPRRDADADADADADEDEDEEVPLEHALEERAAAASMSGGAAGGGGLGALTTARSAMASTRTASTCTLSRALASVALPRAVFSNDATAAASAAPSAARVALIWTEAGKTCRVSTRLRGTFAALAIRTASSSRLAAG